MLFSLIYTECLRLIGGREEGEVEEEGWWKRGGEDYEGKWRSRGGGEADRRGGWVGRKGEHP